MDIYDRLNFSEDRLTPREEKKERMGRRNESIHNNDRVPSADRGDRER